MPNNRQKNTYKMFLPLIFSNPYKSHKRKKRVQFIGSTNNEVYWSKKQSFSHQFLPRNQPQKVRFCFYGREFVIFEKINEFFGQQFCIIRKLF